MALEFSQMENLIKQLSILDLVFRNFIILLHSLPIVICVLLIFGVWPN